MEPLIGTTGLLVACLFIFVGLSVGLIIIWFFVASIVDVLRKTDDEFPDRQLWIILLFVSLFTPFNWLAALVYYFKFKPRLDFWNDNSVVN